MASSSADVALLALAALSCRKPAPENRHDEPPPVVSSTIDAAPEVDAGRPPLAAPWIEKLELPEGGVAFVTPPVGAREPRPIVVAIHGAVDDPGLMCSAWRLIADEYPFVVCPGGNPIGPPASGRKYVWSSGEQIAKRVHQAIDLVRAHYGSEWFVDGPMTYAAFSQGANMAAPLLTREHDFPRVVFTEGGYHVFEDAKTARAFAYGGDGRVLFTCSQPGCAGSFAASRATLESAGVKAKVEYSGPHGHSMPPAVRESIHGELPFLIAGLRGWENYGR